MRRIKLLTPFVAALAAMAVGSACNAQNPLQITYGAQGIQTLSYQGVALENLASSPSDAFHIWHMKLTDLSGSLATCAQCGWGETNNGKSWNAATQTWTYSFVWGTISVQFVQADSTLNMVVTVVNNANSGYIFDGATIYPFVLNFPGLPAGFVNASYPQLAFETTGPGVTVANYGTGEAVFVDPDASKPLYTGYQPTGSNYAYTPIISGTTPDGLPSFQPHYDRPVQPGQTDSFTVSLRFAPAGTPTSSIAADVYQNWAQTWPPQLNWTDRRAIGTVYLASSPTAVNGNINQPGGYPNNPRRYFNDSNSSDFDVTTTTGLAQFQTKILQQAAANATNAQRMNAQGVVTWDIEGEQYPQPTSYVCSPDQIAQVAPEMESVVSNTASPYYGMKLDDAYFKTMTDAGLRVGVCVRPQQFTLNADGTASQNFLAASAVAAELIGKIQFAHNRWAATLFYIDSTVDSSGGVLDPSIFQQVAQAFPDSLLMPEESTPKYYAYTAPFLAFIFNGALGTDPTVYSYYPHAFSAILVNDVDPSTLAANQAALTTSVSSGDILMGHVDYWQANDPTIVQIYQNATGGQPAPTSPTPTPPPSSPTPPTSPTTPTTPVSQPTAIVTITAPAANATISGAVSVVAQINANLDAAGSYLMVDGAQWGAYRASQPPFVYPLDTTQLSNGSHTLQIWAHDTSNNTDLSAPVTIAVANDASPVAPVSPPTPTPTPAPAPSPAPTPTSTGAVVITSPANGSSIAGTVTVGAQISVNLDAAGSYLMVDGSGILTTRTSQPPFQYALDTTTISNGTHTLQVWAHDSSNNVDLSQPVTVTVANGGTTPTPAPSPSAPSAPTSASGPVSLTYPSNGQGISGTISVTATINASLDAAGSALLVDGAKYGPPVWNPPYVYPLNTSGLTPGQHTLQVWAHDTNNDTLLSSAVTVTVTP